VNVVLEDCWFVDSREIPSCEHVEERRLTAGTVASVFLVLAFRFRTNRPPLPRHPGPLMNRVHWCALANIQQHQLALDGLRSTAERHVGVCIGVEGVAFVASRGIELGSTSPADKGSSPLDQQFGDDQDRNRIEGVAKRRWFGWSCLPLPRVERRGRGKNVVVGSAAAVFQTTRENGARICR
jgi:hypothetical protein